MNHTPIDIEQQEFTSVWRGANPREVRDFLQSLARQMADLTHRQTELKAQLSAQNQINAQMQAREEQVKEALVLAQKTVEGLRSQAEREAQMVLDKAATQAQKIVADAENRHQHLTHQLSELVRQRVRLIEELRGLLSTHSRLLDVHAAEVTRQAPKQAQTASGVLDLVQAPPPPGSNAEPAQHRAR